MSKKTIKLAIFSILFLAVLFFILFKPFTSSTPTSTIPTTYETTTGTQLTTTQNDTTIIPVPDTKPPEQNNELVNQDPILDILEQMTLKEKIGQLFILGFDGHKYDEAAQLQSWINEYNIGNFIVFKRNIKSDEQLTTLINSIEAHNASAMIPIWIGIDQEGGKVNRLPQKYYSAEQFAKWNDTLITYTQHSEMAQHLKSIGIDINFAPVLDINSNPKNPVINSRAFGTDATTVSNHTTAVINAYNDEQIIAVGKHFPGHGDTNEDSHHKLPTINKSWEELLQLELVPFQNAIKQNIPSIMVGHLLIKEVDDTYPASLSSTIIQQKLINELGFEGIVMTDDLIMDGILNHYTMAEAVLLALKAGNDMVIIGHDTKRQEEAIEAVKQAVINEEITLSTLNEKVYKILQYKLKK